MVRSCFWLRFNLHQTTALTGSVPRPRNLYGIPRCSSRVETKSSNLASSLEEYIGLPSNSSFIIRMAYSPCEQRRLIAVATYERNPQDRLLMGPGPSPVSPRVLRALSEPVLGHLDPDFLVIMTQTMEMLRYVFQTKNLLTLPMSGTGSAGMETALVNLLEAGDKAVVAVAGVFGQRLVDIVERCGAEPIVVNTRWGMPVDPADVKAALERAGRAKLVAIVHAETSTGVLQPLEEVAEYAKKHGALLVVDAVTSLGGVPVPTDTLALDLVYSGTQKCLGCPPGLAPVTVGDTAAKVIRTRKTKVQSWYLDLSMIQRYWTQERFYHHTAPVSMIYALHEALRAIVEEGIENSWRRHSANASALAAGLEAMGLELLVPEEYRLPSLTAVKVPEGITDADVRARLLKDYNIEIGGGLGELKGKIWRIGLMGYGSNKRNIVLLLAALEDILSGIGARVKNGAVVAAAQGA